MHRSAGILPGRQRYIGNELMSAGQSTDSGFAALRQFAHRDRPLERCELCSAGLSPVHSHLIEVARRKLVCSCEACAILFSGQR